jgi:hypothetical protein
LADKVGIVQSGYGIDLSRLRYKDRLGLFLVVDKSRQFWPEFEAVVTGSELVVTGRHEGRETELLRVPVTGPHDWDKLFTAAVSYFTDGLVAECSGL